jgi:hypothetical protein
MTFKEFFYNEENRGGKRRNPLLKLPTQVVNPSGPVRPDNIAAPEAPKGKLSTLFKIKRPPNTIVGACICKKFKKK